MEARKYIDEIDIEVMKKAHFKYCTWLTGQKTERFYIGLELAGMEKALCLVSIVTDIENDRMYKVMTYMDSNRDIKHFSYADDLPF